MLLRYLMSRCLPTPTSILLYCSEDAIGVGHDERIVAPSGPSRGSLALGHCRVAHTSRPLGFRMRLIYLHAESAPEYEQVSARGS